MRCKYEFRCTKFEEYKEECSIVNNVRSKCNEKAFTTPDNNWVIEVDDVIKILNDMIDRDHILDIGKKVK